MGLIPLDERFIVELPVLSFGQFHDARVDLGSGRSVEEVVLVRVPLLFDFSRRVVIFARECLVEPL